MHCTRALAADALCDDPFLERVLLAYFPPALVERNKIAAGAKNRMK